MWSSVTPPTASSRQTFLGYRNADGSVGTRNLLAVTSTVPCVTGVLAHAVARIHTELLPHFPNVDGVLSLEHSYGCGVDDRQPRVRKAPAIAAVSGR